MGDLFDLNPEVFLWVNGSAEVFFVTIGRNDNTGALFFVEITVSFKPDYFTEAALMVFIDANITMVTLKFNGDSFIASLG